ncbi:MAG: FRG domain-containing protein, partial [Sphingobacteriales bacterium]
MINDITVNSWEELQTELFRDSWNDKILRHRSNYVYRGLWNSHFDLTTSLMRLGGPYSDLEAHLLRNFRKYAHSTASPGNSVWNWMAVAQHHGLPTRLLDWTYSPYVALHFATAYLRFDIESVIWAVNYVKAKELLPPELKIALDLVGANVFTPEILEPVCASLSELQLLQKKDYVIFLEPPSLDARIVHQ